MTDPLTPKFNRRAKNSPNGDNLSSKYPPPFSIRLTEAERKWLLKKAGGKPMSQYVRSVLLNDNTAPRRGKRVARVRDDEALAKTLSALGGSRLASNMNQIAKAANMGALPVNPDLCRELTEACRDIKQMRAMLVKALGLKAEFNE